MEPNTSTPRRVEFVLDLICVHSYLGFTRFERAAQRYRESGGTLEVVFRPFQVAPDASVEGEPLPDVHRRHFGPNAAQMVENMAGVGARDGLELNFGRAVHVNTFEAHRLLAAAADQGLGEPMAERLFRAYLTDGLNIGDAATLTRLAAEVGVKPPEGGADRLRAALDRVLGLGIHSVPLVMFDDGATVSGARSEQTYLDAMRTAPVTAR